MTEKSNAPQWTDEQRQTIEERNKNILVSAAAGSGKTAVLVERIKKLVIDDKKDISSFLITTFTRAAAEEMKQRLEKALRQELQNAQGEDRKFLTRQLYQLPAASISTFHSFAMSVIRQYFYLTDLEPGFTMGDDIQMKILEQEAADQLIEERFEENSEEFRTFLRKYSGTRSENKLKEKVIGTYRELTSIPDYMKWAYEKAEFLDSEQPAYSEMILGTILERALFSMEEAADAYAEAAQLMGLYNIPVLTGKVKDSRQMIIERIEGARYHMDRKADYKEVFEYIKKFLLTKGFGFAQLRAGKDEKEEYALVSDAVKTATARGKKKLETVRDKYFKTDIDISNQELKLVYADTVYFLGLIEQFERIYREKKAELGCIDNNDLMHITIDILKNENVCQELRDKYEFIFVDEYQDSNDLQEVIVNSIKRDNNLFMVGDVKQSIYKFRMAEPELFMARGREYGSQENEDSTVISLNKNFRSKKSVTEAVNCVFREVMDGYGEDSELHCTAGDEYPGSRTQLHIICEEPIEATAGVKTDEDDEFMEKLEAEGVLIAQIIRDAFGREFYDPKRGLRTVDYRDIAILCRGNNTVAELERVLTNEGIPAYGVGGEGYFDTVELQIFMNLLSVINNSMQDIPLISVMKSMLFGFSVRELAEIRISHRRGSYAKAVKAYIEEGSDDRLKAKIEGMFRQIEIWKGISRSVPLDELMRTLLYDTGYYDYCIGLPAGSKRGSNLRLLIEKAGTFEENNRGGLYGFLNYIESMKSSRISENEAKTIGENENVVQIMTIHKSKGLEFPVVILADANKRTSGGGKGSSLHKDIGLGLNLVDLEGHWDKKTLLQKVIDDKQNLEAVEEEVRILYVAMTRAMDRLEIVGSVGSEAELKDRAAVTSYLDMVYAPLSQLDSADINIYNRSEIRQADSLDMDFELASSILEAELAKEEEYDEGSSQEAIRKEVARRLGFIYPYEEGADVKLKYSATELNSDHEEYPVRVAEYRPVKEKTELTAAEAGTVMHLIMERVDFGRASEEGLPYIEAFAAELLDGELISQKEYEAADLGNIARFFESDQGRRAAAAFADGRLYREKEFIMEKQIQGRDVVVQGIIDCFFVEDGGIVLIDYKNSYLGGGRTEEDIRKQYETQIELYREALEESTGMAVSESYLYLFRSGSFVKI